MRNRLISQHILLTAVAAPAQKLLNKSLRVNLFVEETVRCLVMKNAVEQCMSQKLFRLLVLNSF